MKGRIILAALVAALMVLPAVAAEERVSVDISNRPYLGPEDAPVTVIEFLDFQ